jgi:hypothetical protein
MTHPLSDAPIWQFWQPEVRVKATALILDMKQDTGKKVITVSGGSTCREGVLSQVHKALADHVLKKKEAERGYKVTSYRHKRIRLYAPELLKEMAGGNQLIISRQGLNTREEFTKAVPNKRVEEFILVADALVGIPSVLLSHRRPEGDWWRTDLQSCAIAKNLHWNGSDNWFLRHPILLAIATGLYRQAALLTAIGCGERILSCVSREEVEEALTTGDWKLAYGLAEKLRPWIEVPPGKHGTTANYPFPLGEWKRFDRLQRAQRRHNYQRIFGGSFYDTWGLKKDIVYPNWTGVWHFWGQSGEPTPQLTELMRLGEPRRRASGAKKKKLQE